MWMHFINNIAQSLIRRHNPQSQKDCTTYSKHTTETIEGVVESSKNNNNKINKN